MNGESSWTIVYGIAKNWTQLSNFTGSLLAQMIKEFAHNAEDLVGSLGWEDPLEEGMATHSSILAWRIPMGRGAWQIIQTTVSQRVRHD